MNKPIIIKSIISSRQKKRYFFPGLDLSCDHNECLKLFALSNNEVCHTTGAESRI